MTDIMANPLTLPVAGGLLAALLGFGAYRLRQNRKHHPADSSFLESKLQPDSFFGAAGGQNVDTSDAVATGSSMMYSPSQLDAGGDVDPVAEADVYLAYGRDLQAEEILKEALRINPKRVAIHSKLLEIYAKRRDVKAFEVLATEVFALTGGTGAEWEQACALGSELDPPNPLYQPGGKPVPVDGAPTDFGSDMPLGMANTQPFVPVEEETPPATPSANALDLDLDFSANDAPALEPVIEPPPELSSAQPLEFTLDGDFGSGAQTPPMDVAASPAFELSADDLSFDIPAVNEVPPASTPVSEPDAGADALDFNMDLGPTALPDAQATQLDAMPAETSTSAPLDNDNMMSFDARELAFDMAGTDSVSPLEDIPEGDPLETKLSLAAEFMAIGDTEGARSLAEEVVEQATGRLKDKARAFLTELG
ncbi:MAG: FimV/HubP family polar landmark protein [Burkholderiaceae bacterium]